MWYFIVGSKWWKEIAGCRLTDILYWFEDKMNSKEKTELWYGADGQGMMNSDCGDGVKLCIWVGCIDRKAVGYHELVINYDRIVFVERC